MSNLFHQNALSQQLSEGTLNFSKISIHNFKKLNSKEFEIVRRVLDKTIRSIVNTFNFIKLNKDFNRVNSKSPSSNSFHRVTMLYDNKRQELKEKLREHTDRKIERMLEAFFDGSLLWSQLPLIEVDSFTFPTSPKDFVDCRYLVLLQNQYRDLNLSFSELYNDFSVPILDFETLKSEIDAVILTCNILFENQSSIYTGLDQIDNLRNLLEDLSKEILRVGTLAEIYLKQKIQNRREEIENRIIKQKIKELYAIQENKMQKLKGDIRKIKECIRMVDTASLALKMEVENHNKMVKSIVEKCNKLNDLWKQLIKSDEKPQTKEKEKTPTLLSPKPTPSSPKLPQEFIQITQVLKTRNRRSSFTCAYRVYRWGIVSDLSKAQKEFGAPYDTYPPGLFRYLYYAHNAMGVVHLLSSELLCEKYSEPYEYRGKKGRKFLATMVTPEGEYSGWLKAAINENNVVDHVMFERDGVSYPLSQEEIQADHPPEEEDIGWEQTKEDTYHLREDLSIEMLRKVVDGSLLFYLHPVSETAKL